MTMNEQGGAAGRHRRSAKYRALDAERQAAALEEEKRLEAERRQRAEEERRVAGLADETPQESRVQHPVSGNARKANTVRFGDNQRGYSQPVPPIQGDAAGYSQPQVPVQQRYATQPQAPASYSQPQAPVSYSQPQAPVSYSQPQAPVSYSQPQAPVSYSQPQAPVSYSQPQAPLSYSQPQMPVQQRYASQPMQPVPWNGTQPPTPVGQPGGPYAGPQGYAQNPGYPQGDTRSARPQADPREDTQKKLRAFPIRLVLIILAVIALGVGGYFGYKAYQEHREMQRRLAAVAAYNELFCENVYVDGIHLGGMTQEEARAAVTAHIASSTGAWHVKLNHDGQTLKEIRSDDLGVTVDIEGALSSAWQQGHEGADMARYDEMEKLAQERFDAYTTEPGGNTAVIDAILAGLAQQMYRKEEDAEMIGFNQDATDPFTFKPEVIGLVLDTEPIRDELYHRLSSGESGEIELKPTEVMPQNTVESLRAERYALRGFGTTPISSSSDENRTNNIRRAFELISGTIIEPGKQFSFNGVVGERTEKNGFLAAPEYVYEEIQPGIGGGVCQASSTIYQAAVRANMTITKREQHSLKVNYTDYGKDATVYWNSNHRIDFAFANNTEYPIYITAAVQSDPKNKKRFVCNVRIYGQGLEDDATYDIVTVETVIPAPTETEYIRDKNQKYVTYTDQEYEYRKASSGMSVDSYRVKYVKGKEVSREFLYTDVYKEKTRQVYVGIRERPST